MTLLSGLVVAFALFLVALAVLVRPTRAERFLLAFAQSARARFAEQAVRLTVGIALVAFASEMAHTEVFRAFGWLVVVTNLGLLVVPWRIHAAALPSGTCFCRLTTPSFSKTRKMSLVR